MDGVSNKNNTTHILSKLFFIVFSSILVTLNIVRICEVSMTYDEVLLPYYESYIKHMRMEYVSANEHIFNSILRKFFIDTFGDTYFFMRLDSLLAQIIFLTFSYLLCTKYIKNIWLQMCAFLLLNLNPFLFDFWGLSRGYALSIAFMVASIYYFLSYCENKKFRNLLLLLFAGALRVYCNFALLNFYVTLIALLVLNRIVQKNDREVPVIKEISAMAIISSILLGFILIPIKKLKDAQQFYYGGDKNIFDDTICSVVKKSLYLSPEENPPIIKQISILIVSIVFIAGIYWIYKFIRNRKDHTTKVGIYLWLFLTLPAVATIAQHYLLGTKYLIDRTALFISIIFIMHFAYWIHVVALRRRDVAIFILSLSVAGAAFNFISNINTNMTLEWWFDKNDIVVMNRIINQQKNNKNKINLRVCCLMAPGMAYDQRVKFEGRFSQIQYITDPAQKDDTSYDYYYMLPNDIKNLSNRYVVDTSFFNGKILLLKKSYKAK